MMECTKTPSFRRGRKCYDINLMNKYLYKNTDCGMHISIAVCNYTPLSNDPQDGCVEGLEGADWYYPGDDWPSAEEIDASGLVAVMIGSIVEGSDAEIDTSSLMVPFSAKDLQDTIDYVEGEAEAEWHLSNDDEEYSNVFIN